MHGSVSAPSCCSFTHRVAFEEVSGHRVLIKSGPENRGRSTWGTSHGACIEFPREAGLILRGAGKAGNPFQTTQGNQLCCREQERSRSSDPRLPHSNCILPYCPPASLCPCRAALFAPKFFQKHGMDLTVLHIPLAHSVFCPSQVSQMIPSAPKSRDHIMQFLGVPWIPCSFGTLDV